MDALEKKERVYQQWAAAAAAATATATTQITLTKHIMCLIDFCVVLCKCVFGNSVSHKYFALHSRAILRSARQSSVSFLFIRSFVRLFLLFFGALCCSACVLAGWLWVRVRSSSVSLCLVPLSVCPCLLSLWMFEGYSCMHFCCRCFFNWF